MMKLLGFKILTFCALWFFAYGLSHIIIESIDYMNESYDTYDVHVDLSKFVSLLFAAFFTLTDTDDNVNDNIIDEPPVANNYTIKDDEYIFDLVTFKKWSQTEGRNLVHSFRNGTHVFSKDIERERILNRYYKQFNIVNELGILQFKQNRRLIHNDFKEEVWKIL